MNPIKQDEPDAGIFVYLPHGYLSMLPFLCCRHFVGVCTRRKDAIVFVHSLRVPLIFPVLAGSLRCSNRVCGLCGFAWTLWLSHP